MRCHSVSSIRRPLSSLTILPLLSRLGREVARLKWVILVPPWVVRASGVAPTLPARMTRFCMSRFLFWVPKGASLRLTPEKGGHGRCFHRSASAAQGNPDTRGGAGSRGTRQLGPKGSGLEGPNDRLRDQVKKKGWWLWFYEPRNRCRNLALSPRHVPARQRPHNRPSALFPPWTVVRSEETATLTATDIMAV